jgi:parallel beta-helix repeat protein
MGVGLLSPLAAFHGSAIAEPASSGIDTSVLLAQASSTETVLFVDPTAGNDVGADGSEQAPFKTITRALQLAQANTVIQLKEGTYSAETGETFPIQLKPGVTLYGNPQTRGESIVIRGSGFFLSPTYARQKVAVLAVQQSRITGVTITNPEEQGYGVWIESTNPIVTDNTFAGSGHDGVAVNGKGAPIIQNNYFTRNGANGITIYGTSQPEVRDNIFENTGFAINISQKARPLIVGNRITQNKDGIVVQLSAMPVLRNNSVEGNARDGLVAISHSQPDLGTSTEPGGNFFRNNGRFDVNAQLTSQEIPAIGNEIDRSAGRLILVADTASTTSGSADNSSTPTQVEASSTSQAVVAAPKSVSDLPLPPEKAKSQPPVAAISFGQSLANSDSQEQSRVTAAPVVVVSSAPTSAAASPVAGPLKKPSGSISAESFPVPAALTPSKAKPSTSSKRPQTPIINRFQMVMGTQSPPSVQTVVAKPRPISSVNMTPPPMDAVSVSRQAPVSSRPLSSPPTANSGMAMSRSVTVVRPVSLTATAPTAAVAGSSAVPAGALSVSSNQALRINPSFAPIEIPVPLPESRSVVPVSRGVPAKTQPPAPINLSRTSAPSMGLLPVPGPNIPLGNIGSNPSVKIYRPTAQRVAASGAPQPMLQQSFAPLRYRVVVALDSDDSQWKVRSLVPDAFPTWFQGQTMMQVGAFSDRAKADQLVQLLLSQGLRVVVAPLN